MYPIVVVLLDGLADRAHDALGGKTGVEAARTPNLDALCAAGSCGLLYAIGPGRAPSSEVAHWSMLGYRPDEFPGRAVFEALGRGLELEPRVAADAPAARGRSRGRANGPRGGGVDSRDDGPARGRAIQRHHAQVVGPP